VLLKLKDDLVQVISLTEELTTTRIAKSKPAEPAAAADDGKFKVGERISAKFSGFEFSAFFEVATFINLVFD
jgi:hypothetical protein